MDVPIAPVVTVLCLTSQFQKLTQQYSLHEEILQSDYMLFYLTGIYQKLGNINPMCPASHWAISRTSL